MEGKKDNKGLVAVIILLILVIIGMGLYIAYDKGIIFSDDTDKTTTEEKNDTTIDEDDSDDLDSEENDLEDSKTCYGTYYGETQGTLDNGLTYNYKYTYVLNKDNTYTASFSGTSGESGTYSIKDGLISFTHQPEVTAPEGYETPDITDSYSISSDCSYIVIPVNDTSFKLMKQ